MPRDPEAEALIANAVRAQPYAPYFLAQAVIVQDQALQAANQRLEELQAQLEICSSRSGQPAGGGFLSSLGSIFGGGPSAAPSRRVRSSRCRAAPGAKVRKAQAPRGYPPQQSYPPQGAPWGAPPVGGGGGGFLSGALQGAAGVAGGVLLADSIRNLFGGHRWRFRRPRASEPALGGLGTAARLGTGGETIVNNYYDDDSSKNGADSFDVSDDSNNSSG